MDDRGFAATYTLSSGADAERGSDQREEGGSRVDTAPTIYSKDVLAAGDGQRAYHAVEFQPAASVVEACCPGFDGHHVRRRG